MTKKFELKVFTPEVIKKFKEKNPQRELNALTLIYEKGAAGGNHNAGTVFFNNIIGLDITKYAPTIENLFDIKTHDAHTNVDFVIRDNNGNVLKKISVILGKIQTFRMIQDIFLGSVRSYESSKK